MRLNEVPPDMISRDHATTPLNQDKFYIYWREFWNLETVQNAIDVACNEVYSSVQKNDSVYYRHLLTDKDGKEEEVYKCYEESWFNVRSATESSVRIRLRHDKITDRVREQAILHLFQKHLPAALSENPEAKLFLSLKWSPKDWHEILNASTWKALDETLGLYEAHEAEEVEDEAVSFKHLCKIYGMALRGPCVTNLSKRIALRFSRIGFLNINISGGAYQASVGPVYRKLYRIVYDPLCEEFIKKAKEL